MAVAVIKVIVQQTCGVQQTFLLLSKQRQRTLVLRIMASVTQEWLSGKASLEGRPQEVDRTRTLYDIAKAVDFLHARNVCHRGLTPRTLLWFSNQVRSCSVPLFRLCDLCPYLYKFELCSSFCRS